MDENPRCQVIEDYYKHSFANLVLEWNRTSTYTESIVPNVDMNGYYRGKFGDEKLSWEFVDYPEKDLMAVRHEKVTADAVNWDTVYVVNFDEKKISIRLDRTYSEENLVINGAIWLPLGRHPVIIVQEIIMRR